MQHIACTTDAGTSPVLTKLKTCSSILIWVTGLILAGSDGPMMPYLNMLGVILFAGSCLVLGRLPNESGPKSSRLQDGSKKERALGRPAQSQAYCRNRMRQATSRPMDGLAIRPQYARDLGVI